MIARTLLLFTALAMPTRAAEPVAVVPEKAFPHAQQPQVAVDPAGKVFVAFGSGKAVYCVASADRGRSFSTPVKVAEFGQLALGKRRGPRIVAAGQAVVVSVIGGDRRAEDLLSWRSTDAGKTWQGPARINRVAGSAAEGLHGLAAGPDGSVHVVWMDHRERKGQQVWGSRSTDAGVTWEADRLIYTSPEGNGVCPCCAPLVACDPKGGVHVMCRNELDGARDMYLLSSNDGGRTFTAARKLGDGVWLHQL